MPYRYNKLIRNNIPNKFVELGKKYVVHTATTDEEYWMKLKEKLQEELNEFGERQSLESLVDVYEILDAMIAFKKFDPKEIAAMKENKSIEFGTFSDRLVLDESEEKFGKEKERE